MFVYVLYIIILDFHWIFIALDSSYFEWGNIINFHTPGATHKDKESASLLCCHATLDSLYLWVS